MPSQAANLTAIRANKHLALLNMSVVKGALVWQATMGTVGSYPQTTLTVTTLTGSHANVLGGMRVEVYDSTNTYWKGRTRIRYNETPTATSMPIRETSRGTIEFTAGDVIRVYDDVRLTDKLVAQTKKFPPDMWAYSDQGSNPGPIVNDGGPWAGWTRQLPIAFFGSDSFNQDSDSTLANVSHTWTLPAGLSFASGNSASADPTVTGTQGEYQIKHVGTDANNSKSVTRTVPVVIHDSNNPPIRVLCEPVNRDEARGSNFRVRILSDYTEADIPDGAFVILWKEEYNGGVLQSFGSDSGRSHIVACGYIRREEGTFDNKTGLETVSFEVISPMERLEELIGYSKVMIRDASPAKWKQIKGLDTKRAITQLLSFYTNWVECGFDFKVGTYVNYDYPRFYIEKSTPLGQMREVADGTDARLVCTRSGRMLLHTNPIYTAIGARAALVRTLVLLKKDILSWKYTQEHWEPVEQIECQGVSSGTDDEDVDDYYSLWPGDAPGQGNLYEEQTKLILNGSTPQTDINERAGRRGAARNGTYTDANGLRQMALDLEIVMRGSYDVADFYGEVIEVQFTTGKRLRNFANHLFVLVSATVDFQNGTARTTFRLRTCTNGAIGTTTTHPESGDIELPPYTPPIYEFPPIDLTPPPIGGFTDPSFIDPDALPIKLFAVSPTGTGAAYRATSWDPVTGICAWGDIGGSANGLTGSCQHATADPYNYARRYVTTTTGLFKCDDIWAATPVWTQVATNLQITGNASWCPQMIRMSINKQGYIAVGSGVNCFAYSFDYGATWARVEPAGNSTSVSGSASRTATANNGIFDICFAISPRNSSSLTDGHIYASVFASGNAYRVYKSTNWGVSWSLVFTSSNNQFSSGALHVPYTKEDGSANSNGAGQVVYGSGGQGDTSHFIKSVNGGSSWTNHGGLGAFNRRYPYGAGLCDGWNTYTLDGGTLSFFGVFHNAGLYRSLTGAPPFSWHISHLASVVPQVAGINGWPTDDDIMLVFGSSGGILFVSSISGNTSISLNTGLPSTNIYWAEWDLSDYIPAAG